MHLASYIKQQCRHAPAFSRHEMSELCILFRPLARQRAQGMPDAGRTREPCVQKEMHFHARKQDRAAETAGIPCAVVYGLSRALLGEPGFLPPSSADVAIRELDPSIGRSGPHAFAVRDAGARLAPSSASTASHRAYRDVRTPLLSGETGGLLDLICPTG